MCSAIPLPGSEYFRSEEFKAKLRDRDYALEYIKAAATISGDTFLTALHDVIDALE